MPEAAIQALYALYGSKDGPGFSSDQAGAKQFLEPGLARAWLQDHAKASAGKNVLDFDPFIDAQDWDISGLAIAPSKITGDRATVQVRFRQLR